MDGTCIETKYLKEAVLCLVFNICELNSTNKVGSMIHGFLKLSFFEKPEYRKGVYKQIIKFYQFFGKTIKQSNGKNRKN